jgi:hypothetical protein
VKPVVPRIVAAHGAQDAVLIDEVETGDPSSGFCTDELGQKERESGETMRKRGRSEHRVDLIRSLR